jgi:hypothetical protein
LARRFSLEVGLEVRFGWMVYGYVFHGEDVEVDVVDVAAVWMKQVLQKQRVSLAPRSDLDLMTSLHSSC